MSAFSSSHRRRARTVLAAACASAALAATTAACGSSGGGSSAAAATTGGTPQSGGTATYALPPSRTPNYIFPFVSSACGPGVKQGQQLSFNLPYATGVDWISQEMTQLQSNASTIGIRLNLEPKPFNQVTAIAGGNCVVSRISCDWDMANWGSGWTFVPDYDPTCETLFLTGSGANSAGYSDTHNDSLIQETLLSTGMQSLYNWQDYLAQQLPVIWQPNGAYQLTEVINGLSGVIPQSTTLGINPENWYFVNG